MKVLYKKNPTKTTVYDIGVESAHNFVLANGVIAHNCSHAASYSIVAYNGCWLKKNHPLHFWKGELTVNSDNHEKLRSYFSEFKHYLLPISITKSHSSDWSIEGGGLRPPLSLIKGCGAKSVDNLKRFIETPLSELDIGEIEDELV